MIREGGHMQGGVPGTRADERFDSVLVSKAGFAAGNIDSVFHTDFAQAIGPMALPGISFLISGYFVSDPHTAAQDRRRPKLFPKWGLQ
jgi:hypothetical protein